MSDTKLFAIVGEVVRELNGHSVAIEESLQNLIEGHIESFLGIRFLASEHATSKTHDGRIEMLHEYCSAMISAAVTGKIDECGERAT